jgi:hypothetical protein
MAVIRNAERSLEYGAATIPAREESMSNLAHVVQQLRKERNQAQTRIEQLDEALKALTGFTGVRGTAQKTGSCAGQTETKNHVSSGAQTNRCSPARTLGEMEGGTTPQVSRIGPRFPHFHSQIFRFRAENCVDMDEATVYFGWRRRLKGLAK